MNRRAYTGTIPTLTPGVKIGSEFSLSPKPSFVDERLAFFDQLKTEYQAWVTSQKREPITITLPSGQTCQGVSMETTPQSIAQNLKIKNALVARVNFIEPVECEGCPADLADLEDAESDDGQENEEAGQLWDLIRPLPKSCTIKFYDFDTPEGKHTFWHSSAHLLGLSLEQAIGGKVTIGPALQKGFYYDFYGGTGYSMDEASRSLVEEAAVQAAATNAPFERIEISKEDAKALFVENPFKVAIIEAKVTGRTSVYRCGPFVDLCMGPHVPSLGYIKAFEVEKASAAYWLGDAKGDTLQRVYGIAFPDAKLLREHKRFLEEAKKRDHRVLGTKLGYFFFEPVYAPGNAFWTPLGSKIYNKLCNLIRDEYRFRNFDEVITPNVCASELYKVSGHWQNYKDAMFVMDVEGKDWALKPMNCPTHCCIFRHMNYSYKQLPIRMADFSVLHRNEFSGSLTGLTRVRRFQQDDAHIFCDISQIEDEVGQAIDFLKHVYKLFGFTFKVVLSTRPKKALGELSLWNEAEKRLADGLDKCGLPWTINKGDGAFYGPKIDIKVYDALNRYHQCGTIQLDFQMPLRFDLQYKTSENYEKPAEDNKKEEAPKQAPIMLKQVDGSLETEVKPGFARPVMVHRAVLGSVERMTAILLEHYAGKLPFFISPRQALVCPVSEKVADYGTYVAKTLVHQGFDAEVDLSSSTINKKIREASVYQWNYILVVGEKELNDKTVTVRCREDPQAQQVMTINELVALFKKLNDPAGRRSVPITEYHPSHCAAECAKAQESREAGNCNKTPDMADNNAAESDSTAVQESH